MEALYRRSKLDFVLALKHRPHMHAYYMILWYIMCILCIVLSVVSCHSLWGSLKRHEVWNCWKERWQKTSHAGEKLTSINLSHKSQTKSNMKTWHKKQEKQLTRHKTKHTNHQTFPKSKNTLDTLPKSRLWLILTVSLPESSSSSLFSISSMRLLVHTASSNSAKKASKWRRYADYADMINMIKMINMINMINVLQDGWCFGAPNLFDLGKGRSVENQQQPRTYHIYAHSIFNINHHALLWCIEETAIPVRLCITCSLRVHKSSDQAMTKQSEKPCTSTHFISFTARFMNNQVQQEPKSY